VWIKIFAAISPAVGLHGGVVLLLSCRINLLLLFHLHQEHDVPWTHELL